MKKIAYISSGKQSQIISYYDYSYYIDQFIYIDDLHTFNLADFAAVIVSDHCDPRQMMTYKEQINQYILKGGFLLIFAYPKISDLLSVVKLDWYETNVKDWLWWTKPNAEIELYVPDTSDHSFYDYFDIDDLKWHWHGAYRPYHDGESLLAVKDTNASIIVDIQGLKNQGRVFATTLDPHSHNGQRFMPNAIRFLTKFYPWLDHELKNERGIISPYKVAYLKTSGIASEDEPSFLKDTFKNSHGVLEFFDIRPIPEEVWDCDIITFPRIFDEFYMKKHESKFLDFLKRGGQLIINTESATQWLSFLDFFKIVPSYPYHNMKVTIHNDIYSFFEHMPTDFDSWSGIVGQYARGYSKMPENAIWLTSIGEEHDKKPADYIWQYPLSGGCGGKVFVHNGDNLIRYPDHGEYKFQLLKEICEKMIKNKKKVIPFVGIL